VYASTKCNRRSRVDQGSRRSVKVPQRSLEPLRVGASVPRSCNNTRALKAASTPFPMDLDLPPRLRGGVAAKKERRTFVIGERFPLFHLHKPSVASTSRNAKTFREHLANLRPGNKPFGGC
jgi:hypothetical protein